MKVIVTALLFAAAAAAQTSTATVVGRVTDATGAVVPAVEIKITNLGTNISQAGSSNEVGDFTIPLLNPGRYTLEASSKGFHTYKHAEFALEVAQVQRIDITLQVGAATESITITDAPSA